MKLLRKLTAFILVFGLLSGTVAAMSAAVYDEDSSVDLSEEAAIASVSAPSAEPVAADSSAGEKSYKPRLSAPAASNPYYYSDKNLFYMYGWGMPNCTCYAWGRAYEITGKEPDLCLYSAHYWYDYNIENGYYPYGSEPKLGAIACWVYSSGTSGHVAVVEKIANGKITFSNSAYGGTTFYTDTTPIDDPSDGRSSWIFQGYIYVCDYENPDADTNPANGTDTLADADEPAGDVYRISDEDGVNLRSKAGTSSSVIGYIGYDQKIVVTETRAAGGYIWGYTDYNGTKGWFALDFAELVYSKSETPDEPEPEEPEQTEPEPTAAPIPDDSYILGDVDADGEVTILDATRIQRILARMVEPTDYMIAAGDYDGDNELSVLDATRIRYTIACIAE